MLTRKEIEQIDSDWMDENGDESCLPYVDDLKETALALYDENEKLKGMVDFREQRLVIAEAENARLREADESAKRVIDGLVATQDILQRDIDLLRAVVDAAKKYVDEKMCEEDYMEDVERFEVMKAALEKIEPKKCGTCGEPHTAERVYNHNFVDRVKDRI